MFCFVLKNLTFTRSSVIISDKIVLLKVDTRTLILLTKRFLYYNSLNRVY